MEKRLFLGLSCEAPWPQSYPKGRILEENGRHITLAFLGNAELPDMTQAPPPTFTAGQAILADKLLFLPELKPRVAALHVNWLSGRDLVLKYRSAIYEWLIALGYQLDKRPFTPHVTLARAPFDESEWERHLTPIPMITTGIHLYESIGNLRYAPIYSIPLIKPFIEIDHTADRAYIIRGANFQELYIHAATAISFEYPPLITYISDSIPNSLDEVVKQLNQLVAICDQQQGCPLKAVSYHGTLAKGENGMEWEMVIDV